MDQIHKPIDKTLAALGRQRKVGAVAQNFISLPAIAPRTGYICNMPSSFAGNFARLFGLRPYQPPIEIPPAPLFLAWHERIDSDPALIWLLNKIRAVVAAQG